MDYKKEFKRLVEIIKNTAKERGEKLTNEEIAQKLGIKRTYLSDLLSVPGKDVTAKHVGMFKEVFKNELNKIAHSSLDPKMNSERAMLLALLVDYSETQGEKEGLTPSEIRARIKKRADLILDGLDTWFPE
jgi:transcriptional regulator with XRE-family HTH domain